MKKRSGSKIKVYREWNDKKPFKATLGKKISNKGKHGNYDDVYMATIDGEDKEIKVAYGELSKMEPPRDVWFMMNSSELNEVKIKNQIKEEIIRILSEGMTADEWADAQEEERLDKHPEKNIIKKVQDLISQEKEKKEITRPLSEEEIDAIYDNFIDTNKYKETVIDDPDGTKENATLKIDTPDGKSYKVLTSAEDDEKWWKLKYIREEEMTDAEMEKKAEKEAKSKEAKKISDVKDDLAKQQKMLKKLKDVMKDRAKDYKKAEGKEKDNIKTELKTLTLAKKKIEAKIKKLDKQL